MAVPSGLVGKIQKPKNTQQATVLATTEGPQTTSFEERLVRVPKNAQQETLLTT